MEFLGRLTRQSQRKVFLIVDSHPVHRSKKVKSWIEENSHHICLFFLPGYSPELNPDAIFRPFRVGDVVELENEYGTIEDMALRHTVIRTWQNKRRIIPNSRISEETIINWTIGNLTVLWAVDFGISYDSDIEPCQINNPG
ncbi:MAG: mechanosensitive ion channel [Euryarchaeota archaeon]|nr:mechanosensitive ion channel [Euryarchaeota archaeon]